MLTVVFNVQNIYIWCFVFLFKAHIYYCEVLLISVKSIVNNKDIDEYCITVHLLVFSCQLLSSV